MKNLIIFATCFFMITSAAIAQDKKTDTTGKTTGEVKKESTENVEKVKEKSGENIQDITGKNKKDLEKPDEEKVKSDKKDKKMESDEKGKKEEKTQTIVTDKNRKKIWFSGYFAPVVRFSQVDTTKYSTFVGYKGAFMIEGFGIGTALFVNADYKKRTIKDKNRDVFMGYTGFLFEYNFLRKKVVNFSIGTIVGIGSAGYFKTVHHEDSDESHRYVGTRFFVLEPEVVLYINVTRFFRMGLGGSYRYINGLMQYNLDDDTYSGFSGSLLFQFGWF